MAASDGRAGGGPRRVEFASKATADAFREQHGQHLAPADDARTATVTFGPGTPPAVIDRAEAEAFVEHGRRRTNPGEQVTLSEAERNTLKRQHGSWSWQRHGFEAMRAKGALQAVGATDWMNYYEPGEGVDGALHLFDRAKETTARTGAPSGIDGIHRERDSDDSTVQRARADSIARAGVERERAADALRDNLEAIEAGEKTKLVDDIEAEFGAEFVTETLEAARQERDAPTGGAPEPKDYSPSAVAHANGAAGAPGPDRAPAPGTTPGREQSAEREPAGAAVTMPQTPVPAPGIKPGGEREPAPEPVTTRGPERARRALGSVITSARALGRDIIGGVRLYRQYRREHRGRQAADGANQQTLGDYTHV